MHVSMFYARCEYLELLLLPCIVRMLSVYLVLRVPLSVQYNIRVVDGPSISLAVD